MAQQAPSIRDWLSSALPNAPFVYSTKPRTNSRNRRYTEFGSLVEVQEWHEARDLLTLAHLGGPLGDGLAVTKPVVLDAFHVLAIEANLQHFFDLSLIYCVNLALHYIHQDPIAILPHIPFTRTTALDGSISESKSYTPDYTVIQGPIGQDPTLLTNNDACLIVGDVKLYGRVAAQAQVNRTDALTRTDLGQLLWYCVSRKTRFGFCVSDVELVLMEFVVNNNKDVEELSNVVARAESELSSPVQAIPLRGKPVLSKRRYASSTTGSTVSPSDRHQHKRSAADVDADVDSDVDADAEADAELVNIHEPAASSPSLPSSIPERSSPRTPELEPPYSSDPYVPSTPGEITAETLEDLASVGGSVIVRLLSFPIDRPEHWAPALFGFISFAQSVDTRGTKGISATPVSIRDYLVN
ncbi:hypothetical protein F5Y12DRAFT_295221 [Xylaria sp. FL1777]|nr:hypothetical protein F5Y12DRAFT_295221 [Xylaria sp. FL1777]